MTGARDAAVLDAVGKVVQRKSLQGLEGNERITTAMHYHYYLRYETHLG
jgi:hypothetical protein